MWHASDEAGQTALRRFHEAVSKAQHELREDTSQLQTLQRTLQTLCEANMATQSQLKAPTWRHRLDALHKERIRLSEENAHLRAQLQSNEAYMAQLRAGRTEVEKAETCVKESAQAAREAYINEALKVHAEVLAQMDPSESLLVWQARKDEAEKGLTSMQTTVEELRQRSVELHRALSTLTGTRPPSNARHGAQSVLTAATEAADGVDVPSPLAANEEEAAAPVTTTDATASVTAPVNVQRDPHEERQTLLMALTELAAQCAQREGEKVAEQETFTTQRDALRAELTALCEEVETLDMREQEAREVLRQSVHDAASTSLSTTAQDTRCRTCHNDILSSFV